MAPQAFEIMEFMPENGAVWRAQSCFFRGGFAGERKRCSF